MGWAIGQEAEGELPWGRYGSVIEVREVTETAVSKPTAVGDQALRNGQDDLPVGDVFEELLLGPPPTGARASCGSSGTDISACRRKRPPRSGRTLRRRGERSPARGFHSPGIGDLGDGGANHSEFEHSWRSNTLYAWLREVAAIKEAA